MRDGDSKSLEARLAKWSKLVIEAKRDTNPGCVDTRKMMLDIDKILADEFDHSPMFEENL